MKRIVLGCLALVACCQVVAQSAPDTLRSVDSFASITDAKARSAALFQEAGKVIQHPRCVNCHPRTDRPLQGDAMQLHQPLELR